MESGNFSTMNKVMVKFVNIFTEVFGQPISVLFYGSNNRGNSANRRQFFGNRYWNNKNVIIIITIGIAVGTMVTVEKVETAMVRIITTEKLILILDYTAILAADRHEVNLGALINRRWYSRTIRFQIQ